MKKLTKKARRRLAHLDIATLIWHAMMDGAFGQRDSPESDVAFGTVCNHLKWGGETLEYFKPDEKEDA